MPQTNDRLERDFAVKSDGALTAISASPDASPEQKQLALDMLVVRRTRPPRTRLHPVLIAALALAAVWLMVIVAAGVVIGARLSESQRRNAPEVGRAIPIDPRLVPPRRDDGPHR